MNWGRIFKNIGWLLFWLAMLCAGGLTVMALFVLLLIFLIGLS